MGSELKEVANEAADLIDELVLGLNQLRYVLKSVAIGDDQREIMPRCIEIVDAALNEITRKRTNG